MKNDQKPPKRRYTSKGCARCQGQGVVVVYERRFIEHGEFVKAVGAAQALNNDTTTSNLRGVAQSMLYAANPMGCPDCRNMQEAASV